VTCFFHARPSKAEKTALRQAIVACKAEAKGKKIKWLSRQQLRHRSDEGPSQDRCRDFAQALSEFDGNFRSSNGQDFSQLIRLSRGCAGKKIRERFAVLRRADALLRHFSPRRVGIRSNLEKFCDRLRIPDDVHLFERFGEMIARQ